MYFLNGTHSTYGKRFVIALRDAVFMISGHLKRLKERSVTIPAEILILCFEGISLLVVIVERPGAFTCKL